MKDSGLEPALPQMLSEEIASDPMGRQRWIRSSLRNLSRRLKARGHQACTHTVARLLRKNGVLIASCQEKAGRCGAARSRHPIRIHRLGRDATATLGRQFRLQRCDTRFRIGRARAPQPVPHGPLGTGQSPSCRWVGALLAVAWFRSLSSPCVAGSVTGSSQNLFQNVR
jgi:Rhodopirellula transposase DDE domain